MGSGPAGYGRSIQLKRGAGVTITDQPDLSGDRRHNFIVTLGYGTERRVPAWAARVRPGVSRPCGPRDGRPDFHERTATCEDERLGRMHRAYAEHRDAKVREALAGHYDDLALHIVRRFHTRRETFDDLAQVARIGSSTPSTATTPTGNDPSPPSRR